MDLSKASTIICLTLVAVIAINFLIYFGLRRGIKIQEIDVIRQISDRSRSPWRKEQEDMDELAKLVENLKGPMNDKEDDAEK